MTVAINNLLLLIVYIAADDYSSPVRFATEDCMEIRSRITYQKYQITFYFLYDDITPAQNALGAQLKRKNLNCTLMLLS